MDKTMRQDVLDTMNEINSLRDENERITRLLKGWIKNIVAILFVLVVFISGVIAGSKIETLKLQSRVIEHGCGQYNKHTGSFEWINHND